MGIVKKIFAGVGEDQKIYKDDKSWLQRKMSGKEKPKLYRIIKRCPGGLHSMVESSVGIIRKENKNIPSYLFV